MISVKTEIIPLKHAFAKRYRLAELLAFLGNPQHQIPTINVVGTNGKGSTTISLAKNLEKYYHKVGCFISPAFLYHNERIRINDQMISDFVLNDYLQRYQSLIKEYNLTFFEIWTLIMIVYFAEQKVDVAIVEAGIGGAKDATNVMSNQLMVVLTSLSRDHTEILGNSIGEILAQKLGIAKGNCPIFISADNHRYASLINLWSQKHPQNKIIWGSMLESEVDYQRGNKGLVAEVFKYLNLSTPRFSSWLLGRFTVLQEKPFRIIIDGAHNEGGLEKLLLSLEKKSLAPEFLFAFSNNKDYDLVFNQLMKINQPIYLTTFDHPKAWKLNQIEDIRYPMVDWKVFLQKSRTRDLVISGSLYFIAQVYEWWIAHH